MKSAGSPLNGIGSNSWPATWKVSAWTSGCLIHPLSSGALALSSIDVGGYQQLRKYDYHLPKAVQVGMIRIQQSRKAMEYAR
jgi:hypothetical protein